jgi:hypothetical protein
MPVSRKRQCKQSAASTAKKISNAREQRSKRSKEQRRPQIIRSALLSKKRWPLCSPAKQVGAAGLVGKGHGSARPTVGG